jgi:hypothetical protein
VTCMQKYGYSESLLSNILLHVPSRVGRLTALSCLSFSRVRVHCIIYESVGPWPVGRTSISHRNRPKAHPREQQGSTLPSSHHSIRRGCLTHALAQHASTLSHIDALARPHMQSTQQLPAQTARQLGTPSRPLTQSHHRRATGRPQATRASTVLHSVAPYTRPCTDYHDHLHAHALTCHTVLPGKRVTCLQQKTARSDWMLALGPPCDPARSRAISAATLPHNQPPVSEHDGNRPPRTAPDPRPDTLFTPSSRTDATPPAQQVSTTPQRHSTRSTCLEGAVRVRHSGVTR